jgi:tetratricopeptide (TPR) repeat protein
MNKAFLSHSSAQKPFVRKVASLLGPVRCTFDEYCFEMGEKILDEIIRKLNITDIFVIFISNEALNSPWVQREIIKADELVKSNKIKQILPILIDSSIDPIRDRRIPEWMKEYLLKYVASSQKAFKIIANRLRQLDMETNTIYQAKRNLFIGRHQEKEELENTLNLSIEPYYKCIFVSGVEGIGRRTFLERSLKENGFVNEKVDPYVLQMSDRATIDDFLLFLIEKESDVIRESVIKDIVSMNMPQKIEKARVLLQKSISENEYVFIIDNGCIVRPSMQVAEWFSQVIDFEGNVGNFYVSVVSRFRPSQDYLQRHPEYISIAINALSDMEVKVLYNRYSRVLGMRQDQKHNYVQESLNGIPAQVYYSVEYVHRFGIDQAIRNIENIIDYGDKPVLSIVAMVKKRGTLSFDIFILLCNLKTTSYGMIYNIAGDTDEVNAELAYFFVIGVFSLFGENKEYIEVNNALADYVHRSKMKLRKEYQEKMQQSVEHFIEKQETNAEFTDLSSLYHDIKGALLSNHELPSSYYLPSFVLNSIAELYNLRQYLPIVRLVDKMLKDASRYDRNTVREFKYWLCQSLARMSNERFMDEVNYFGNSADYYFLKGFYYRIARNLDEAEDCFLEALDRNTNHQRSKRELVNVYIMKGDFTKGLSMAKENFDRKKTNPFHVQAYFICLIQEYSRNIDSVKGELDMLMRLIKQISDPKAKSIQITMAGEYAYFVERDMRKAIDILEESVSNSHNTFSCKVLEDIYRREHRKDDMNRIHMRMLELSNEY